jgi:hypothetical protein
MDMDGDVHTRNKVEVVESVEVVEDNLDWYDLGDLLEGVGALGVGLRELVRTPLRRRLGSPGRVR